MAFYAAALQVLRTCGDTRVAALLARSVRELNDRAARIADAETRRDYLGVAEHRAILSD